MIIAPPLKSRARSINLGLRSACSAMTEYSARREGQTTPFSTVARVSCASTIISTIDASAAISPSWAWLAGIESTPVITTEVGKFSA
jgi:hypothetical protein